LKTLTDETPYLKMDY